MGMPRPGTEVAITVEPAGGSQRPTTEPIVQVDPSTV
jgi:anti-sigma-K factor RskA